MLATVRIVIFSYRYIYGYNWCYTRKHGTRDDKPDHGGSQSSNQLVVQYEIMLHYPVICSQTRVNIYT